MQEHAAGVPKCAPVDVDFLFPSSWGNSVAYQRLRHLRAIEASALHHQIQRQPNPVESECTAIRRIDALMEIQRRECFRRDGIERSPSSSSHFYMYGVRNEDGEPVRTEYVRDRMWPPKEFALKNAPKTGGGRGGGRKRKIPEKTPAQMDEERLAMDFSKTCVDCSTQHSPLWRQVDAAVEIPETDQEVIIPKEDICLMCYVQRTTAPKIRAQLLKKKKEKTSKTRDEAKSKKAATAPPVVAHPVVTSASDAVVTDGHDPDEDEHDDLSTGDEKRRKKSSKKSSKKHKKKKSKRSSSSVPASPILTPSPALSPPPKSKTSTPAPLVVDDDTEPAPPAPSSRSSRSSKESSKKRSRELGSPTRATPKSSKSSKRETAVVVAPLVPQETPREKELRAKGQYCPVCNRTYEDDDASEFVCCDSCEMWVHSLCDPQLNAYVRLETDVVLMVVCSERMKELADTDAKYIGPCCATKKRR
ncbi:Aste57867_21125 [Aphanomyces stellatus]|uniref:Aste57867_21125 protein n=1 Tax=Aphanomyces stellatus TaxID=120398 RepID=A0A485LGQ4_9STRA|nr:hypothetical protein As57867_021057 [Aphanomyces stellatus]VFT97799.1 Aste57867_21125 [Aphanomyces stellatus]